MKELNLECGTLWKRTLERTNRALKIGALLPISTESRFIHDSGVDFQVRIVSNLARKEREKRDIFINSDDSKNKPNPFLPYDKDMFVSDISDTHVCLLNKFNVIDHHLLIVTRYFEDQEILLTLRDFEAVCACMDEFDGLVFYNGGEQAGASQRHKHLQMIPLPMVENGLRVPIEPLFAAARLDGDLGVVPGVPFVHCYTEFRPDLIMDSSKAAKELFRLYRNMLQAVGLNRSRDPEEARQTGPYNLLLTRQWMLLVPRSEEFFGSISINALGFAGALLVLDSHQMQLVKDHGGMAVLKHTAIAN